MSTPASRASERLCQLRLATNNARIMIHDVFPLISRLSEYLERGTFFLMHCLETERKVSVPRAWKRWRTAMHIRLDAPPKYVPTTAFEFAFSQSSPYP